MEQRAFSGSIRSSQAASVIHRCGSQTRGPGPHPDMIDLPGPRVCDSQHVAIPEIMDKPAAP